jgi:hypothetical protein
MKKYIKKIVSMFLVFAMVIAVAAPGVVQAATKVDKKQTMYIGEAFEGYLYGSTIKSVKSSNSKVVKAAKSSDKKYGYTMTAKKKGTATITVKYKYGSKSKTYRLKITVKKLDVTITSQRVGSYVLFSIKNNTAQCFDRVYFSYELKDSTGSVLKADETSCSYIASKATGYDSVYFASDLAVDGTQTTAKVTAVSRDPQYTYKNATTKQLTVTKKNEVFSDNKLTFNVTYKNKTNYYVYGYTYVFLYDAADNIIGMIDSRSIYLSKKQTDTKSFTEYISPYTYPTYDHYKIVTGAYYSYK